MRGRGKNGLQDVDMFGDDIYSSQNRAEKAKGKSKKRVPKSTRTKAREKRMRLLRNRAVLIIAGVVILALLVVLFTVMFKGCGNSPSKVVNVSTETKFKQEARKATPSEATPNGGSSSDGESKKSASSFKTPNITDDNSPAEVYGECCVWNSTGFLRFVPDQGSAEAYASAVNRLAEQAPSVNFYNMVVPSSTELCLPDRLKTGDFTTSSQAEFITSVNNALSDKVKSVNAYDSLVDHNNDYIYYKSDDNWTDLGAYYGYDAFAKATGQTPLDLANCEDKSIEGFYGSYSLYTAVPGEDTVHYRVLPYEAPMDVTDQNGVSYTNPSPYYEAATSGSFTYGVFLVGDNPLCVIRSSSPAAQKGKKLLVVKEDYGDAIAPYLSYNYGEVHVIDYRYFDSMGMKFSDYCSQNGITDVLVINDVKSAGSQTQIGSLSAI